MRPTGRVIQYTADEHLVGSFTSPGFLVRAWFSKGDMLLRIKKEEGLSAKDAEKVALQRIYRADRRHVYGQLIKIVVVKDTEENRTKLMKQDAIDNEDFS